MAKDWQAEAQAAEAAALQMERVEADAEAAFDAYRSGLSDEGRAHQATQSEEFRTWMAARRDTDEAWRLWLLANEGKPQEA